MKRKPLAIWSAIAVSALLAGCSTDHYARQLIQQDTSYGRIWEAMVGTSDQLVKTKSISAARRYTMPDKTELDVWVVKALPRPRPRGTVLVIHGLCDSKVTYLRLARMIADKGFDVILPDLRAHGRSTGKYVTYGALEKQDLKRVVDELLKEGLVPGPVYAFGQSMGAAVAIQYAAIEPSVKGVMAIAPSRDLRTTCRRLINNIAPFMSNEDFEKVLARAGEIAGFDPNDGSSVDAIAKLQCPVLLVHGKLDVAVPYTDSEVLYAAANDPKELQLDPLAGHIGMPIGREAEILEGIEKIASGRIPTTTQPVGEP